MAKTLVADDVQEMRDLLKALLTKFGHGVYLAATGQQVVALLKLECLSTKDV